jgi:hypothetical protein
MGTLLLSCFVEAASKSGHTQVCIVMVVRAAVQALVPNSGARKDASKYIQYGYTGMNKL